MWATSFASRLSKTRAATKTKSEAIYTFIAHKRALAQYGLQTQRHKITKLL